MAIHSSWRHSVNHVSLSSDTSRRRPLALSSLNPISYHGSVTHVLHLILICHLLAPSVDRLGKLFPNPSVFRLAWIPDLDILNYVACGSIKTRVVTHMIFKSKTRPNAPSDTTRYIPGEKATSPWEESSNWHNFYHDVLLITEAVPRRVSSD